MNDQVRIPQWLVLDVFLLSGWVSPVSQLRGWVLLPGSGCQAGERDLAAPGPVCSLSCHLLSPVSSLLNNSAGYAGIERNIIRRAPRGWHKRLAEKTIRITRQTIQNQSSTTSVYFKKKVIQSPACVPF